MSEPTDDQTAYGHDQDREPPLPPRTTGWRAGDHNPDDLEPRSADGAEVTGGTEVNPATGQDYGQVDNTARN